LLYPVRTLRGCLQDKGFACRAAQMHWPWINPSGMPRIIFITGTDTGVGKTLLTGLLLQHLRRAGRHALAMKPFCSGGRGDARLLHELQGRELSLGEVNPFYFEAPLAPLPAARMQHVTITLEQVLERISRVANRCECLLVEGVGGILVPLGEGYTVADLIAKLRCEVVLVSANRLGTLNHTILTARVLQDIGISRLKVALMAQMQPDPSCESNGILLAESLDRIKIVAIHFLGANACRVGALKRAQKKVEKSLAEILA